MKILVTGCNGYIGSHLLKKLSEKGYQVEGLDYKKGNDISHYMFNNCGSGNIITFFII